MPPITATHPGRVSGAAEFWREGRAISWVASAAVAGAVFGYAFARKSIGALRGAATLAVIATALSLVPNQTASLMGSAGDVLLRRNPPPGEGPAPEGSRAKRLVNWYLDLKGTFPDEAERVLNDWIRPGSAEHPTFWTNKPDLAHAIPRGIREAAWDQIRGRVLLEIFSGVVAWSTIRREISGKKNKSSHYIEGAIIGLLYAPASGIFFQYLARKAKRFGDRLGSNGNGGNGNGNGGAHVEASASS